MFIKKKPVEVYLILVNAFLLFLLKYSIYYFFDFIKAFSENSIICHPKGSRKCFLICNYLINFPFLSRESNLLFCSALPL